MSNWAAGYVADTEYTAGFYRDQSPSHLNLACALAGVEGVPIENGFSYCELGCGQGFTAMLLAAANPQGRFHAIDFNPAHIARAQATVAAAKLENVTFLERSFAELAAETPSDLPQFDFVTLHGVYSWITTENRRAIVAFLRRHLKPGGIVYVSYNSMPGWAAAAPVQRLLYEYAMLTPDRSDRQFARAAAFAGQLKEAQAHYLRDNPLLNEIDWVLKAEKLSYLAHEYLNGSWSPLYHLDVARDLAEAKLSFVGSAGLLDGFPELVLSERQRELLADIGVPALRETLKDYCVNRRFRKDVFVRGPRPLTLARQDALLRQMRLALVVPRSQVDLKLEVPAGEASLEARVYDRIFDALAERPTTVAELLDLPELKGRTTAKPREVVGMLVGSSQALPIADAADGDAEDAARRFNQVIAAQAQDAGENSRLALAVASLGTGLYASAVELVTYHGLASGAGRRAEDLAPLLWASIAARGEKIIKDGVPVESEAESLALIRERIEAILRYRRPLWQNLGVI